MDRIIYRSRIDWWAWTMLAVTLAVTWLSAFEMPWWYTVVICGGMTALVFAAVAGCRYEIDGGDLVIYQFFRPTRLPIAKIKDVKKVTGYLATAGMSSRRVSISLTDPTVLKSYAPIEISPRDRDGFIDRLTSINPDIKIK